MCKEVAFDSNRPRIRIFEYGVVCFNFRDGSFKFAGYQGDIGEDVSEFDSGKRVTGVRHPANLVSFLGRRGWEILQVDQQNLAGVIFSQYHLRRSTATDETL